MLPIGQMIKPRHPEDLEIDLPHRTYLEVTGVTSFLHSVPNPPSVLETSSLAPERTGMRP